MKWISASKVLCDRRIPIKLRGNFYKIAIRLIMLYDTECFFFFWINMILNVGLIRSNMFKN